MPNEEEDYLDENFDYSKLTIPKLKKILFENGIVDFPARVKKDQLLEIYKENIHDRIDALKRKKKQEFSRAVNKYQSDRSSIMDLEENENDRSGGLFTGGRVKRIVTEPPAVPIEERLKVIKNGTPSGSPKKGRVSLRGDTKRDSEQSIEVSVLKEEHTKEAKGHTKGTKDKARPRNTSTHSKDQPPTQPPTQPANKSFLDSIGAHLRNSSIRRSKEPSPIKETDKHKEAPKKRIFVDVNSSDFSSQSFFDVKSSKGSTPQKKVGEPAPTNRYLSLTRIVVTVLFVVTLSFVFLKMLPYCTDANEFFCVRVPDNGRIVNGRLVCNKGFIFKRGLFGDSCVRDDTKEVQQLKALRAIVSKLKIARGNFVYGISKDFKMKLADLTTNEETVEILKRTPGIVISNGLVWSTTYRTTLRVFIRHYSKLAFYVFVPFVLLLLLIRFWRKKKALREERKASSDVLTRKILNVLLRQLIMSTKNSRFPSYVSLEQLKDVFMEERPVWQLVEANVRRNSNVREDKIDNKEIWEWVGPLIQSPDDVESLCL